MSRLLSPRGKAPALADVGERSAFIAGQKVGRARRLRARHGAARWGRALAFALLGLSAPVAATYWLLTSPRFAVAAVEVRGASRVPTERILAAAGIAPRTNIWRIDPGVVVGRVEAVSEIRRADVIRELPNRLIIFVEERRPFTLVHAARLHWLDEEGHLLGEERGAVAPPVPVISGLTEAELQTMRTEPAPRARAAIALIRTLLRSGSALASEISEIDMSRREGPVLYTVDGVEVRLGTEEWEERLARLEGVLANLSIESNRVRAIDLRFRDQVVLSRGGRG